MTIKEAVELYNKNNEQITKIRKLFRVISDRNCTHLTDPMGYYQVSNTEMEEICSYLGLLANILEAKLNQEFDPSLEVIPK